MVIFITKLFCSMKLKIRNRINFCHNRCKSIKLGKKFVVIKCLIFYCEEKGLYYTMEKKTIQKIKLNLISQSLHKLLEK